MNYNYVSAQVSKLNYAWYQQKKSWFEKETFYNKKKEKIFEVLQDSSYSEDQFGESYVEVNEVIIDIDFFKYCWNSGYPDSLSTNEKYLENLPFDSSHISFQIINWIDNTTRGVTDIAAIHKVILAVIQYIENTISTMIKEESSHQEFIELLDDFLKRVKQEISKKYGNIKLIHHIVNEYNEKERLTFTLNQEELGALLYILYAAGFIYTPTPTDTGFINFCDDRFYFYNQKEKKHTKATQLRNKFNDAKNSTKTRQKFIERLKKAFMDL